jgi:DNA polymerase III delta prime subunit
MKRACNILDIEGVSYDKPVVAELIKKYYPDWRRVINELQRYSANGKIDTGIFANLKEDSFKVLVGFLADKNFTSMRKWVAANMDNDSASLFRMLYDTASETMAKESIPNLVLILAKYQYQAAFCADQEVNLVAALVEVMIDCQFT